MDRPRRTPPPRRPARPPAPAGLPQAVLDGRMLLGSGLLRRGWPSYQDIDEILGPPDERCPNPYHAGAPLRLYQLERVLEAERSEAYSHALHRINLLKREQQDEAVRRMQEAAAETAQGGLMSLSLPELEEAAYRQWCEQNGETFGERELRRARRRGNQDFMQRICVNYARHALSRYDSALRQRYGMAEVNLERRGLEHRELFRAAVRAIAARWPSLEGECRRQLTKRYRRASWEGEGPAEAGEGRERTSRR